jgi:glyoxylase-like metal-dependent hydrolase (beta-lactamase superfamily II)
VGVDERNAESCEAAVTARRAPTTQIDSETLREWLDRHRPVTVVDVRGGEDHAEWAIPGSVHVDAYEALRRGDPGQLAHADFPRDRPVVTVCNAGVVSQTAAAMLAERGFDAHSLSGGMTAWSVAWNTAPVTLADTSARVVQVRRTGKGCLSYVVSSGQDAAVIDPSVSSDVYSAIAQEHGWSIRFVLDTHVHADHVSRARDLAHRSGATLLLPPQDRVAFAFTPFADGERLSFGSAVITALHTPGHTDESTSFLLNETALFTGDTLFTNGVGRPDLHASAEAMQGRAAALFASLTRLGRLPPSLVVLPAHASEPIAFDGHPVAARLGDIEAWLSTWLASEPAFVERLTSHLPSTPPNFARIVRLNEAGEMPVDVTELEAGANRCAVR